MVSGGIGINTAHELVHRRHAWERGLGVALLSLTLYAHFRIEHVHGHHRRVATPDDPATARLGEGVYASMPGPSRPSGAAPGPWRRSGWPAAATEPGPGATGCFGTRPSSSACRPWSWRSSGPGPAVLPAPGPSGGATAGDGELCGALRAGAAAHPARRL
ncbi:fatty acid desaturase [Aerophototrophica crusticola]|uniref:fatty acid desaturase n=1 Tax=Aerophototrophica crusticola TaxID=1709002 RepID=UPI00384F50AD